MNLSQMNRTSGRLARGACCFFFLIDGFDCDMAVAWSLCLYPPVFFIPTVQSTAFCTSAIVIYRQVIPGDGVCWPHRAASPKIITFHEISVFLFFKGGGGCIVLWVISVTVLEKNGHGSSNVTELEIYIYIQID